MDYSKKLALSYYKTIAVINEPHKVYLVQHQETSKIYIKKVLDVYNPKVYDYLYRHPVTGVPRIIDYSEEDGELTVIEEYISGTSLAEKIQNHDLSESDIRTYMDDLCSIVNKLHSARPAIIHRDIKPSNIIITSYNHPVLLDFNAAKFYSLAEEDTVLLGTQGYAAPEQYGFGSSSPQTDIYALGIVLKKMAASLDTKSDHLDSIIDKCTQLNPAERFENVSELKENLDSPKPMKKVHNSGSLSDYTLPGFRTRSFWKMTVASITYLLLFMFSMSLKLDNTTGIALWIARIFFFLMALSIVFGCFNYMNVQRFMPLCQSKKRWVRYIGIAILDAVQILILMVLLIVFEAVLTPA